MTHAAVIVMLKERVGRHGLNLVRFFELGSTDALTEPELRDLWLIWGTELASDDVA